MKKGKLIVVSGPSGVGKDTVVSEYLKLHPEDILSVSMTSRPKRDYEIDGVHYYFRTKEGFEEEVKNGNLLEYATYNGNYYGTPKSEVIKRLEGITCGFKTTSCPDQLAKALEEIKVKE